MQKMNLNNREVIPFEQNISTFEAFTLREKDFHKRAFKNDRHGVFFTFKKNEWNPEIHRGRYIHDLS